MSSSIANRVQEIMTKRVLVIQEGHSFTEVQRLFQEMSINHLPVTDADRKLIGMVSSTDVLGVVSNRFPNLPDTEESTINEHISVLDVMTPMPLRTIGPDSSLTEAANIMAEACIHALPVVDSDQNLVGMITSNDLIRHYR
jgi:CBS domain-containing membrane protein